MVKKVTLDTLEIKELEIPLSERTLSAEEVDGKKSGKQPARKWLWISTLVLVLLIAGGVLYWRTAPPRTSPSLSRQGAPPAAPLQKGPLTARTDDFIITFQDDKGKYLVLACDLTFELSAGQDAGFRRNLVEIRKKIYETLKKTSLDARPGPSIRDGLKTEINKAVSGLLGQEAIKAIYFTKFVVL